LGAIFFGRRTSHAGPLVFLNACGSSKVTPEGVSSFPSMFLRIGSRGVIGTETSVPDLAAAEFAREFYTRFFKGFTLGEALFDARMRLLRNRFNPIGALYSAYANADLRVRAPIRALGAG
jgi:CHAT domain-containing protein